VIPSVHPDGTLSKLKAWEYEDVEVPGELETWTFNGKIKQISSKNRAIVIRVSIDKPRVQALVLTIKTAEFDQFQLGERWTIRAIRTGNELTLSTAQRHSDEAILKPLETIQADYSTHPESIESIEPANAAHLKAVEECESEVKRNLARSLLIKSTQTPIWMLDSGTARYDHQWETQSWEFDARADSHTARVKLVDEKTYEIIEFLRPSAKETTLELDQRLNVTPLGAAQTIGASCFRVEMGPYEIILDCGTRPKGHDPLPMLNAIEHPDLMLISHAHQDHIGALPVFHARFSGTPIVCTRATREIAQVMLVDGLKVQQSQEDTEPLFDATDLAQCLFRMQTQPVGAEFEPLPGLKVRFINAGHIVGAVCIHLRYKDRTLLYTGDYSLANSRTTDGLKIQHLPQTEVLITETTYGNTTHPSRSEQERALIERAIAVVKQGGNVLIPAFALGRAQEIILAFRYDQEFRALGIPLYIDGLVRSVTDCFNSNLQYLSQSVQRFARTQELFFPDKPMIRAIEHPGDRPLAIAHPSVIVTSSGMLNGGPSVYYAQVLLERSNAALLISGYCDEESPGRKIQALQTGDTIEIAEREITVRAAIHRFSLSAHADKVGICSLIERVNPQCLILVHGSRDALHELARSGDVQKKRWVFIPSVGETIAYDSIPKAIASPPAKRSSFEITLEAETIEGGWLRIPSDIVEQDSQWQKLTETGVMKATWSNGRLVLTPVRQLKNAIALESSEVCCGNCQFYDEGRCICTESALFEVEVDITGRCPDFEASER